MTPSTTTPDATTATPKPRKARRKSAAVPDWASMSSIMTFKEKSKLNRCHRGLDTLSAKLLIRTLGGDPAGRPGPAAAAAAERLAHISNEIPWMG
jgi:hypothetical protein